MFVAFRMDVDDEKNKNINYIEKNIIKHIFNAKNIMFKFLTMLNPPYKTT